jgi:hypothetical protein
MLFADIKGSMDLIEDLDPEEARAIVDPALKLMMEAVQRYGGYVAQPTGDFGRWKTRCPTFSASWAHRGGRPIRRDQRPVEALSHTRGAQANSAPKIAQSAPDDHL